MRPVRKLGTLAAASAAFLLAACSSFDPGNLPHVDGKSPTKAIADKLVQVSEEYRGLRLCLLSAVAIEIMTDRVRLFDPTGAATAVGRLISLQGMIDTARQLDPRWVNTSMAVASFVFSNVLLEAGASRIATYVRSALSVGTFVEGVRRLATASAKGAAMLRDVNLMFASLEDGTYSEEDLWSACFERNGHNRITLLALAGG